MRPHPIVRASGLAVVAALGLASPVASAATYHVGNSYDYPSLREALAAYGANGSDPLSPDVILIHSDDYDNADDWRFDGPPEPCGNVPLPIIVNQYELTIRSTGGAAATAPVPPISASGRLTIEGLTVWGGAGHFGRFFSPDTAPDSECVGPLFTYRGPLTATDVIVEPGPYYGDGHGIATTFGQVHLTDVEVSGDFLGDAIGVYGHFGFGGYTASLERVVVSGTQRGIALSGVQYTSLTDVSVSDVTLGPAIDIRGGTHTFTRISLTANPFGGIYMLDGTLDVADSIFEGQEITGSGGAILYERSGEYVGGGVLVSGSTFTANTAGGVGGAIAYFSPRSGTLRIVDSTFSGGAAEIGGHVYVEGRLETEGVTFSEANAVFGGAVMVFGDGTLTDTIFESTQAEQGGGLYFAGEPDTETIGLRLSGVSFSNTNGDFGGAFAAGDGSYIDAEDVSVNQVTANGAGGAFYFGVPGDLGDIGGIGDIGAPALVRRVTGVIANFTDLAVTGVTAPSGGAFYLSGGGHAVDVRGGTFQGVSTTGSSTGLWISGEGGIASVGAESRLALRDVAVSDVTASGYGGLVASGVEPIVRFARPGDVPVVGGGDCPSVIDGTRLGNEIVFENVRASGLQALNFPVATFGVNDAVRIEGSSFTDATVTAVEEPITAAISSVNVATFDMQCSEVCGVDGVDHAVFHADVPPAFGGFPRSPISARPQITYENSAFTGNAVASSVLGFEVCTGLDERNVPEFDTGGPVALPGDAGRIEIRFNTFLDNTGTQVGGRLFDYAIEISSNIFDGGDVGIGLVDAPLVRGDHNLYNDLIRNAADDARAVFPGANAAVGSPLYAAYTPGTCGNDLWQTGGPAVDGGDPRYADWWDGSRADIGAYGGPYACFPDEDEDGFIVVLDCNDVDPETFPGANETPYDTIDQDCDGFDLCDIDEDGFDSDHPNCGGLDCDDALPEVNPDQVDIPYDGRDQDCDGEDACDVDGDGVVAMMCGGTDCDDADATVYPGAPETPGDDVDSNCDGVDDPLPDPCDADGDGALSAACGGIDCDDGDASVYPGAPETPGDDVDSNCDGEDDPPDARCDDDGDGVVSTDCGGIDCDDADAGIHPGAEEVPYDGIDQDCDGLDLCDVDGDGFDADNAACGGDDCDDEDPTVYPGAPEIPDDGIDQNCDLDDATIFVRGGPSGCGCATGSAAPTGIGWMGLLGLGAALVRRRRSS